MMLRVLPLVAVVLLVCAAVLWFMPAPKETSVSASKPPVTVPVTPTVKDERPLAPQSLQVSPLPEPASTPTRLTSAVMPGQPVTRSSPAPVPYVPPVARPDSRSFAPSEPGEPEGQREMEEVRTMFSNYRARLGENPTGTNAEIMKAVMGGNKDRLTLGPPHGQSLNKNGELLDPWGTPYFFHQLSKDSMEIRSAGPDRMMWTPDDLVTK